MKGERGILGEESKIILTNHPQIVWVGFKNLIFIIMYVCLLYLKQILEVRFPPSRSSMMKLSIWKLQGIHFS